MSAGDWVLLTLSHSAAAAFGTMAALLWLPPDVPALLLGLAVGALTVFLGVQALDLIKTARRRG